MQQGVRPVSQHYSARTALFSGETLEATLKANTQKKGKYAKWNLQSTVVHFTWASTGCHLRFAAISPALPPY
jgi:hypothetical protein